jgi:hypothetical protein
MLSMAGTGRTSLLGFAIRFGDFIFRRRGDLTDWRSQRIWASEQCST